MQEQLNNCNMEIVRIYEEIQSVSAELTRRNRLINNVPLKYIVSEEKPHIHINDDIQRIFKGYPFDHANGMIYDYQFNTWTKVGSGKINEEDEAYVTGGYNTRDGGYFYNAGVQCANITTDYDDEGNLVGMFNSRIYCCEFSIEDNYIYADGETVLYYGDDAKNKWILGFYNSLTASGGTVQPYIGVFCWGTATPATGELGNSIGVRRVTKAGGSVQYNHNTGNGIASNYHYLFIHDPNNGEYLYYSDGGSSNGYFSKWQSVAYINTGTTLNTKHLRVNANLSSSGAGYTCVIPCFRLSYLEQDADGNYLYVPVSNWDYVPNSANAFYWDSKAISRVTGLDYTSSSFIHFNHPEYYED